MFVTEIFCSTEGEGIRVGTPEVFIRFAGCSIGCRACDTPYALNKENGKEMSVEEIVEEIEKYKIKNVVLTGGSPLEQELEELRELIYKLKRYYYYVVLEESGQKYDSEIFDIVDFLSLDIKTPSSGVKINEETFYYIISMFKKNKYQFKMVVSDDKDWEFVKKIVNRYGDKNFVVTPCWNINQENVNVELIEKILKDLQENTLPIRIIVQQHKLLYKHKRGV